MGKRGPLHIVTAVVLLLGLAMGCSSSDDGGSSGGSSSSDDSTPAAGGVQTEAVTVEHAEGATEVPADPQRIANLGEEFLLADLFELGLGDRVAISTANVDLSPVDALGYDTEGIEVLSSVEPDLESLAAAEPDLILAPDYVVEEVGYDQLAGIAPTVPMEDLEGWQDDYRALAATFGPAVEASAEDDLAAYDEQLAAATEALGAEGRTVSAATVYPGASITAYVDGPINVPQALVDLGFELVPGPEEGDPDANGRIPLSLEQVGLLEGEDLVMLQSSSVEDEDAAYEEVSENTLWTRLPAVEADRVHVVDRLGYPGLQGRVALLDDLQEQLAR